jgi:hypothetical protein
LPPKYGNGAFKNGNYNSLLNFNLNAFSLSARRQFVFSSIFRPAARQTPNLTRYSGISPLVVVGLSEFAGFHPSATASGT